MYSSAGKVVIGGGTGFIGSHLARLLKNSGYGVTVISRMPGPQRMTWHELSCSGLPEGTTAVVNLAGQNVLDPKRRWTHGFKQNVYNSRVNTTRALAQSIIKTKNPPAVFVTMSGVGIYEPSETTVYTEESLVKKFDFLSDLCIAWEKAGELPPIVRTRHVIIRSGVVLGRKGGMIKNLYLPFLLGLGGPIGSGEQYLPWIHIDDLTRLILHAIHKGNVGGVLNGVAPDIITNKEFTNAFAKALWRPAVFPVPKFMLNILLNKERAKMMTEGQRVVPKKVQQIGFEYKYPDIESACKELATSKEL